MCVGGVCVCGVCVCGVCVCGGVCVCVWGGYSVKINATSEAGFQDQILSTNIHSVSTYATQNSLASFQHIFKTCNILYIIIDQLLIIIVIP